jgi:hypothetical protein
MAVMLSFLVLILGYSLSELSRQQLRLAVSRVLGEKAQAAADAGVELAVASLASDATYSGTNSAVPLGEGPETYRITVLKAGSTTAQGQTIPSGCVYIASVGTIQGVAPKSAGALVKLGSSSSAFKNLQALITNTLSMSNGVYIDSYDSKSGPYKKSASNSNASVVTNLAKAGSLKVYGGSRIYGTVAVGPSGVLEPKGTTSPTTSSVYTVWHDWGVSSDGGSVMTAAIDVPSVSVPAKTGTTDLTLSSKNKTLDPGVYGDVNISNGAKLTLQPGVYQFHSLTLNGGTKITLADPSSPVQFYIETSFDQKNGVNLSSSDVTPSALQIFMADGSTYTQSGGSSTSAIVYGPNSTMNLNNGSDLYGSAVASAVTMNGAANIHWDESLANFDLPLNGGSSSGGGSTTVLFRQRS